MVSYGPDKVNVLKTDIPCTKNRHHYVDMMDVNPWSSPLPSLYLAEHIHDMNNGIGIAPINTNKWIFV